MFSRNDSLDSDSCIRAEKAELWTEAVPKEGMGPLLHEISVGIYLQGKTEPENPQDLSDFMMEVKRESDCERVKH